MDVTAQLAFVPKGDHSSGAAIATALTLTPPEGASQIMIQVLTQNARYTMDGTVPTASLGFQMKAGDPPIILHVAYGEVVKIIQEAATASLQYQWGGFR